MHRYLFMCVILFFSFSLRGQNTVGLLSYDPSESFDGYNLIYPHNQSTVYLLNSCGEVAHSWTDEADFAPGNTAYLMENGNLVKTKRPKQVTQDAIWAGGGGATVEIRDWDNQLLWTYTVNNDTARLHHDIEPMPGGNILMLAWESLSREKMIELGRDTAKLQDVFWPDFIIEVDPTMDSIVWEWHVKDHLIQDFDSTKQNYGVVSEHPELMDINYDNNSDPDWMHSNAIDYHPLLDQIMICIPYFDELWIIDHTTTTAQAAGHIGGLSGRGGDLLYRWGNQATYTNGNPSDQRLFFPHDAHWIDDHLDAMHPLVGGIAVFNNQFDTAFSAVNTFMAPWDMYAWTYTLEGQKWGPETYASTITHPQPISLYSTGLSSVQFLSNENILICSGREGYAFELTPDNEIVWEYKTPVRMGIPVSQGDQLTSNDNLTFRMDRYPSDYPAFDGKDLEEDVWIELEPDSAFCDLLLPIFNADSFGNLSVYPNPASVDITIQWQQPGPKQLEVYNTTGKKIRDMDIKGLTQKTISTDLWPNGLYLIRVDGFATRKVVVH